MKNITLEKKIEELKKLSEEMTNTNNGALDIIDALVPLNVIDDITSDIGDDIKYIIKLKREKTKIGSINQLTNITREIIGTLSSETEVAKLKVWVDKLKSVHYKVTEQLQDELYFQPISNEIGSRTLGKNYDTQTLTTDNWEYAAFFRTSISQKIKNNNGANSISSYAKLNNQFADQISSDNSIPPDIFYTTELQKVIDDIHSTLKKLLKDAIRLINYLYPINTLVMTDDDLLIIDPVPRVSNTDDSLKPDVVINIKGDKVPEIAKQVNNGVLCPCTK